MYNEITLVHVYKEKHNSTRIFDKTARIQDCPQPTTKTHRNMKQRNNKYSMPIYLSLMRYSLSFAVSLAARQSRNDKKQSLPQNHGYYRWGRGIMRGNMTQVHVEFTCLEVENFCVLVAHLVLAHQRQPFELSTVCNCQLTYWYHFSQSQDFYISLMIVVSLQSDMLCVYIAISKIKSCSHDM